MTEHKSIVYTCFVDEVWLSSGHDAASSSSVYLLNPLELNLMVEKSLLPNDTRLPG